jgi:hypothetical protein
MLLGGACNKNSPATSSASTMDIQAKYPAKIDSSSNPHFSLTSPSIKEGQNIDAQFTCSGADISPALSWTIVPPGTKSLVLIMDDPDAPSGTFTHWLLYDVSPEHISLPEGVEAKAEISGLGKQGRNDFGKIGYNGPCPPAGSPHHYRFKLYALSGMLNLAPGSDREALEKMMEKRVLVQATLTGIYQR